MSHIYASEIARGLDIFELTPTKVLTQNEIDAAKAVRVAEFNVQNQEKIVWPRQLIVAKAYVDQLERTQALPADQIAALRKAIQNAESSNMNRRETRKTEKLRAVVGKERCHDEECRRLNPIAGLGNPEATRTLIFW